MFAVTMTAMVCAVLTMGLTAVTVRLAFRQRHKLWAALTYDEMTAAPRAPRVRIIRPQPVPSAWLPPLVCAA
jgi:hypothetical protein